MITIYVVYRLDDKDIEFVTRDKEFAQGFCTNNKDAFDDTVFTFREFRCE